MSELFRATDNFQDEVIVVREGDTINIEVTDTITYQVELTRKQARKLARAVLKGTKR